MKILHRKINLAYSLFTFTYYLNKKHPEGRFLLIYNFYCLIIEGLESGGSHCMRESGFFGGEESKGNLNARVFEHECRNLLLDSICKAELEDRTCNGWYHGLIADDNSVP